MVRVVGVLVGGVVLGERLVISFFGFGGDIR